MSAALTQKQEKFATAYIELGNASEAYRQAYDADGMTPNSVHREAHAVLENPKVASRVAELQAEHRERHKVTIDNIVKVLANILHADPGDYFDWGPDGVRIKDKASLTLEQRLAIGEVSQTITEAGGTIRVKLLNKLDAADKLGRHLGMFKDGNGDTPPGNVTNITRIERLIVYPPNSDGSSVPAAAGEPHVQGGKGRES